MISSKKVTNAVGGKTARACDNCVKKRARWYCAADDAFLCQACDSSVHSANSLARRHERVRLKTSSSLKPIVVDSLDGGALLENSSPPWQRGVTRKARTPRNGKSVINHHNKSSKSREKSANNLFSLVPEVGGDETSHEENEEEQLLYRVPIFDPLVTVACDVETNTGSDGIESKANNISVTPNNDNCISSGHEGENSHGFLPSEMDLEEFAADVESLLGKGLENECFGMEELGLVDCCKEKETTTSESSGKVLVVKVEAEEEEQEDGSKEGDETEIDMMREPFELNFEDYDSPASNCSDEDGKVDVGIELKMKNINGSGGENDDEDEKKGKNNDKNEKRKILLKLDYEAVLTAWSSSQRSPWTTGDRPELDTVDCWPEYMGICGGEIHQHHHAYGDMSGIGGNSAMANGGREARVSRYREKRRTRLFSKKIRYEVRKLNAEKRPRMKGRFVKRASFASGSSPAFPRSAK
ncbi:zinc finger protein CONSTANS-LIKE 16 [Ziziphus jujuba]|uniref:Zinc finger protein CONSTANS-LIKE 16 n=1 Tax=Ziziphus jujuba TaxID=326968 RepID=A0ABM3I211_ZIZJJ|nr:zinc finger protein CONSTANS-LIKE 16 [Ziziphus jujuba]